MVATDTPEKMEIQRRHEETEKKKSEKKQRAEKRGKRVAASNEPKKKLPRKRILFEDVLDESQSSNEEDIDDPKKLCDDGGDSSEVFDSDDDRDNIILPGNFRPLDRNPTEGEYVLIEFQGRKAKDPEFYIAKVLKELDSENDIEVSFLRRSSKVRDKFCVPNVPAAGFCNSVSLGNARSDGDNERSRTLPSPNDERYSLSSWIR